MADDAVRNVSWLSVIVFPSLSVAVMYHSMVAPVGKVLAGTVRTLTSPVTLTVFQFVVPDFLQNRAAELCGYSPKLV